MAGSGLEGRVALVTGGARGIGAATAERLAEDGAAVAIADLDIAGAEATAAQIAARCGVKAIAIKANVAAADEVERMVEAVALRLGSLDILVNNAGITRDNLIHKMSDDDWDAVAGVHLRGAFLCSRAAQREMVKRNWGRIVNLSSVSALGNRGQGDQLFEPPRPGCRAWRRRWRSNSAAMASPPMPSRPALLTPR